CVPYWSGDNGGATSKGVTRDEVRIGAPDYDGNIHPWLQAFFNKRFEFYGRKLQIVQVPNEKACPGQQADATAADEQFHVFATMNYNGSLGQCYYEELSRRRIVSASEYAV